MIKGHHNQPQESDFEKQNDQNRDRKWRLLQTKYDPAPQKIVTKIFVFL